jgi:flagellum-specific peptidoglycan hydrolase FlgJ
MITNSDYLKREQIVTFESGHFDLNLFLLQAFLKEFLLKHWLNIILALMLTLLIIKKDINLTISTGFSQTEIAPKAVAVAQSFKTKKSKQKVEKAAIFSAATERDEDGDGIIELLPQRPMEAVLPMKKNDDNVANKFENLTVFDKSKKESPMNAGSVFKEKQEKCWSYITRFVNIAKAEKAKFGIPVSITLAQGLLESDAGESQLTRKANNHFGVKTFNKNVSHVVMKDDTPKDKFKKYNSAWESFRDHSQLLMREHYKHLQFLSKTDYVGWAKGLEKAGYATDPLYAEKLVKIIESLKLFKFDEV